MEAPFSQASELHNGNRTVYVALMIMVDILNILDGNESGGLACLMPLMLLILPSSEGGYCHIIFRGICGGIFNEGCRTSLIFHRCLF